MSILMGGKKRTWQLPLNLLAIKLSHFINYFKVNPTKHLSKDFQ